MSDQQSAISRQQTARKNVQSQGGLTFVELLIAGTIFAILLVGVAAHLRGSVVAWRRTTVTVEQLQQVRVALNRLEEDLANGFVFEPTGTWVPQPVFESTRMQWYVVRPAGASPSATKQVRFVTYELRPDASGSSLSLVRTSQTPAQAASNVMGVPEPLLASVQQLAIRYGSIDAAASQPGGPSQPITWLNSWVELTQAPKLVEVTVQLGSPWAIPHTLRRVFVMPPGSLSPSTGPSGP